MKEHVYNLVDLFAGAGGLSNGFQQTQRFNVVAAIELNEAAQSTYIINHNNNSNIILKDPATNQSDITKIDFTTLNLPSDQTVVVGGPPCQGFSNANRQKNYLISGNNQLVKEYVRAIRDIKPVAFLMENVKTMHSSVHKFFVTKTAKLNKNDFSSLQHLDLIAEDNEPIYSLDQIDLLVSNNDEIREFVENFESLSDVPSPFISATDSLTLLRTLQKRFEKKKYLQLKDNREIRDVQQIVKQLSNYQHSSEVIQQIITKAIVLLEQLTDHHIRINEKVSSLVSFNEFNRFLTRCKELNDEEIECLRLFTSVNELNEFTVKAEVYSYNVVEYLKSIFKYYGYQVVDEVLDSSHYGVPQKRKRFIMMGVRKDNIKIALPKILTDSPYTVEDAIKDLEAIEPQTEISGYKNDIYYPDQQRDHHVSPLLDYYRENLKSESILFNHLNTKSTPLIKKRFEEIKNSNGKNFHSLPEELKSSYTDAKRTQNTVYLRLKYEEPSPTVVNVRKSMWQHPTKARALSVREAARLQSFQDQFIFIGRKDEQYQQVGNAVPPLLAKALATNLLKFI
ncbi:DNA cytosine methyltransferase [Priestia koreensis]|uniref:DNA (cytosine-5-)-methyltransferase n=1 Tax=Priestia koreensis TaxID=284581 RepID=A0A0M0L541_9BACI|nr:DNA cytosine methyltransferase [Priestia koreensis]KOO45962.1 hypothetical protein AMD01_12905 [Priestia koreensis]